MVRKINSIKRFLSNLTIPNSALILFYLVSIIAILLAYSHLLIDLRESINLIVFALAVSTVVVIILYFAQLAITTIFTFGLTQGISIVILMFLVGLLRGYLMNNFIPLVFSRDVEVGDRRMSSAITTIVWLGLISIAINLRNDFRQKFEGLISQGILNDLALIPQKQLSKELRKIENDLQSLEIPIKDALLSSEGFKKVAQEVDNKVRNSIRPLSHKLWAQSSGRVPKFNIFYLFREAVSNLNYSLTILITLSLTTTLLNLSTFLIFTEVIIRSLVIVIVILVLHYLRIYLLANLLKPSFVLGFVHLTMISVLPQIIGDSITGLPLPLSDTIVTVFAYLIIPGFAFLISYINELQKNREEILALIEKEFSLERISGTGYVESLQLASYLHNNLANEYRSIGRKIESLANDPNSFQARQAIEQLGALINRSISKDFREFYESPLARLTKLPTAWKGILDIDIRIPEEISEKSTKTILLTQIVEELISNTSSHLDATYLIISISKLPNDEILIVAENDGQFIKNDRRGIGSKWFQSFALKRIEEIPTEKGYKLTITI